MRFPDTTNESGTAKKLWLLLRGSFRSSGGHFRSGLAGPANQAAHRVGGLGTITLPVVDALEIELPLVFLRLVLRVVGAEKLDITSVAARSVFCNHYPVERVVTVAVSLKSDLKSHFLKKKWRKSKSLKSVKAYRQNEKNRSTAPIILYG